jgi:hypothetical protein
MYGINIWGHTSEICFIKEITIDGEDLTYKHCLYYCHDKEMRSSGKN